MIDRRTQVMSWLEGLAQDDWPMYHSDSEVQEIAKAAFALLEEQKVRELTMEEWQKWRTNTKRDPICMLWENDTSPMWIFNPEDVHEPALLMGKIKLFTGKPTFEQCKAAKWNGNN